MQSSKTTPAERLDYFIRACNYGGDLGEVPSHGVVGMISRVYVGTFGGELPEDDHRLLKMAAAAVAFHRNIRRIASTETVELDYNERQILDAVLEVLRGKEAAS